MNKMILFLINRRSLLLAFRLLFFFFNDTATTEIYTSSHIFPYTTLFRSPPPRKIHNQVSGQGCRNWKNRDVSNHVCHSQPEQGGEANPNQLRRAEQPAHRP